MRSPFVPSSLRSRERDEADSRGCPRVGPDDSVGRLERLLPARDYRALAASLAQTKCLAAELDGFKTLDRVGLALRAAGKAQAEVRAAVTEEFEGLCVPPRPPFPSSVCSAVGWR